MAERNRTLATAVVDDIYERSVAEARDSLASIDYVEDLDGRYWVPCEKRSSAMQFAAGEFGCRFIDVRCTRAYMTIDLDAIREAAEDIVASGDYDADELATVIAYTWDGEGWLWTSVPRDHADAVAFWLCEERSR